MNTTESDYILIGRNETGEKIYVKARFEYPTDEMWRTKTDHTQTTERLRLAINGAIISKYGNLGNENSWVGAGQNYSDLLDLTQLESGWTVGMVHELHEIWTRWHLNDMRAGCDHQRAGVPCPEGYREGSAWLYESLPWHVFSFISNLFKIEPPVPGSSAR